MKFMPRLKVALFGIALLAMLSFAAVSVQKVSASYIKDCSTNSIMQCGAGSADEFIRVVKLNAPGDLPTVYSAFSLAPTDYSRFVSTSRVGTLYKSDGRIVVDGQVVAKNAWSIGREKKSYSWNKTIGSKTYYASYAKDVLLNDSLPVMVMFNKQGVMEFAVMNACGNPTTGTLVTPKYSCDLLQKTAVSGKKNTYSFTTKATATNNAKLVKLVYNFGDGTSATTTSTSQAVTHTYTKPGTYTATVTAYVSLPGSQTVTVTSATCKTTIEVVAEQTAYQQCISLTGVLLNKEQRNYEFMATTSQGNGATLKDASFDFGDGVTASNVPASNANSVKTTHSYTKDGTYTVKATVNFNTASGVKSVACETSVNPTTTTTLVCQYNQNLPADSEKCAPQVQPAELTHAGPAGVIGLFAGTSVVASLAYRWFAIRRSILG